MSASRFKFVSPGIFVNEIDNSQLPAVTPQRGPVIIGRTERGPSMRPVQINSFSEYIETFGDTVPGGRGGDVWRNGNYTSPMYASYAAQAWLKNSQTATVIRLLGVAHPENDGTDAAKAGWGGYTRAVDGGASYGLFIIPSASAGVNVTGTLGAIWYVPTGSAVQLSGALRGTGTQARANAALIGSIGGSNEFKVIISEGATDEKIVSFNFNPDSDKFIRKAFNTNPILTNSNLYNTTAVGKQTLFLGHSFERAVADLTSGSTVVGQAAGDTFGMILGLEIGASNEFSAFKVDAQSAHSGWIISQDTRGSTVTNFDARNETFVTKLFKLHARDGGEWENRNLKISIDNVQASTNSDVDAYGTFDVLIRSSNDLDNAKVVYERFTGCNLNPNSVNFISRKIGDQFSQYDATTRRFRTYGQYPNLSKFVRVEVNSLVEAGGADPTLLPFGFHGPFRPSKFQILSGTEDRHSSPATPGGGFSATFATSSALSGAAGTIAGFVYSTADPFNLGQPEALFSGTFEYPAIKLRASASNDSLLSTPTDAYFGYDSRRKDADRYDASNNDLFRILPNNVTDTTTNVEISVAFTLDDIQLTNQNVATYSSGSRQAGTSATAVSGNYTEVLDAGYNKFTIPMFGGHNGVDITESDPFANRNLADKAEKTGYAFNSIRRAINTCADPEIVDYNLMVAPGITNTALTDLMINTCEERGDALAITDLPDIYNPAHEGSSYLQFENRPGTLSTIVTSFKNRRKNSSYGATYYPWVQIRDSLSDASLWVPPSVVALGTFSNSDRVGELWFAPAGFNRGGLSQGSAGLTVTGVTERLSSDQRDDLYEVNINPIASFPNEGIVVFGQKTMDATTSALSRINVRRLLIFLKKEISRLSGQVLFDQNVEATWGRFQGLVRPVLESVKVRFGLTDYKLLLDETTTTPDLVDRNVLYAKIFLKPARAIEFIALDFIITRTGAAFED